MNLEREFVMCGCVPRRGSRGSQVISMLLSTPLLLIEEFSSHEGKCSRLLLVGWVRSYLFIYLALLEAKG